MQLYLVNQVGEVGHREHQEEGVELQAAQEAGVEHLVVQEEEVELQEVLVGAEEGVGLLVNQGEEVELQVYPEGEGEPRASQEEGVGHLALLQMPWVEVLAHPHHPQQ